MEDFEDLPQSVLLPQLASFKRIEGSEWQPDKTREIKILSFY